MTDIRNIPTRWRANSTGDTAKTAAKAVEAKAPNKRAIVLACIREHGPITPEEISRLTGIFLQTCRARCSDLRELGLIVDSGLRGTAAGGQKAIRWAAKAAEVAA